MIFATKTSLSVALSTERSKYTPGERTSCDTTTRSVPLMMKVPLSVMSGKSPMKTVCDLISPVSLFMNSAVTNSGAEYVKSFSRHWSTVYFGGSKRWSRNDSDIDPAKSSIGLISSKISVRPEAWGISELPEAISAATRARQSSPPRSQSKLAVCRASRSGTASGSRILAKETRVRPGERGVASEREEAKISSFHGAGCCCRAMPTPRSPTCQIRRGRSTQARVGGLEGSAKRQSTCTAHRCPTRGVDRPSSIRLGRRGRDSVAGGAPRADPRRAGPSGLRSTMVTPDRRFVKHSGAFCPIP